MQVNVEESGINKTYQVHSLDDLTIMVKEVIGMYAERFNREKEEIVRQYFKDAADPDNREMRDTLVDLIMDNHLLQDALERSFEESLMQNSNYDTVEELIDAVDNLQDAIDTIYDTAREWAN